MQKGIESYMKKLYRESLAGITAFKEQRFKGSNVMLLHFKKYKAFIFCTECIQTQNI
jgi:hypothetical protein